jgi:hypothetical protein
MAKNAMTNEERRLPRTKVLSAEAKLLANQSTEAVLDFGVARDGGLSAVGGIEIKVVAAAVAVEEAAGFPQFFHEGLSLHTSTSIDLLWASTGIELGATSDSTRS